MKNPALLSLLLTVFVLLPRTAAAAEPEAVYAKYHHAVMAGEIDEMLKWSLAQRRTELQSASPSTRSAALTLAQYMSPRAYKLENKAVNLKAGRATLTVSGPWEGGRHEMDTVYGIIRMVLESGEWRVDEGSWSYDKPPVLANQRPAGADKAGKAAVSGKGAPVVGSTESGPPVRKLGEAKQECVYKPVMTAEDVERCR